MLSREIIDLSIPMLKRLQRLRLATGGDTRLALPIDNSSHLNQQWYEVLYDLKVYALDRCDESLRDTEIWKQFTILLNALALSGVHIHHIHNIHNPSITENTAGLWQRMLQLRQQPYRAVFPTLKILFLESSVLFRHPHCRADGCCDANTLTVLLEGAQSL